MKIKISKKKKKVSFFEKLPCGRWVLGMKSAVNFGEATNLGLHSNRFLFEAENLLHQRNVNQHQFPCHKPTYTTVFPFQLKKSTRWRENQEIKELPEDIKKRTKTMAKRGRRKKITVYSQNDNEGAIYKQQPQLHLGLRLF